MTSFGICSTPKESKYVTMPPNDFQYRDIHQD